MPTIIMYATDLTKKRRFCYWGKSMCFILNRVWGFHNCSSTSDS